MDVWRIVQNQESEAIEWIHGRRPFGSRPGLSRIKALLALLDNPQDKIRTVHIGGTNGKGSVVAYLRCLLEEQGFTVGTYTSPYIVVFNERVSINGIPISGNELASLVARIKPLVFQLDQTSDLAGITEFEVMTALMFLYFCEKKVDLALIEVGLGGLLDCTNVITPLAAGIVTIGYDHTDILGESLEAIAIQKAGIIKPTIPVVTGKLPAVGLQVVTKQSQKINSPVYRYNEEYRVEYRHPIESWGEKFDYFSPGLQMKQLQIPLLGRHQADNAGVAIKLFELCGEAMSFQPNQKEIQKGLNRVSWPGRMERIAQNPLIILDGAHNEPAMTVLADNLRKEFKGRDIHVLFAAIDTKDTAKMLAAIQKVPNLHLVVTTFDYPNALSSESLAASAKSDVEVEDDWIWALGELLSEVDQDAVVVVTGSLYFISQVRQKLLVDKPTEEMNDEA